MNLIYEGNKFEFDIPNGVTIKYIKDLSSKICQNEEKEFNLIYNDENLLNYNNKVLLSSIVPKGEKTITIHLEKKEIIGKNLINSSNVSTSDTIFNDKHFKSVKNKFKKFNSSYSKIINEISNFSSLLESTINKIIQSIKLFENNINQVNEKLNEFYSSKSYNKLKEIFEENKNSKNINEIDLKELNHEIESYVINYKYLLTQHNFQINILDFINQFNDKLKFGKIKFSKIENEENYENIVSILDNIFTELLHENNKDKNENKSNENGSTMTDYISLEQNNSLNKKQYRNKRLINDFPKIEYNNKENFPNHFYTYSDKTYLKTNNINSYMNGKTIKLLKKGNLNASHKNLSFSSKLNQSKSKLISPIISIKTSTRNFLPGLENLNKKQMKTFDFHKIPSISQSIKGKTIHNNGLAGNKKNSDDLSTNSNNIKKNSNNTFYNNNNHNNDDNNNNDNNNNNNNNNNDNNNTDNNSNNDTNTNNKNNDDDEYNEKEFKTRNTRNNIISERVNQTMNLEVKPKIMDKNFIQRLTSRNNKFMDITPINKTVNNIEEKKQNNSNLDIISLKPKKKNQNKIPLLFEHTSQENKNLPNKEKKEEFSVPKIISSAIKKIYKPKTNNNSNNNSIILDKKSNSDSKEIKSKFKFLKNDKDEESNSSEKKNEEKDKINENINNHNSNKNIIHNNNNKEDEGIKSLKKKTNLNSALKINLKNEISNLNQRRTENLITLKSVSSAIEKLKKTKIQNDEKKKFIKKYSVNFDDFSPISSHSKDNNKNQKNNDENISNKKNDNVNNSNNLEDNKNEINSKRKQDDKFIKLEKDNKTDYYNREKQNKKETLEYERKARSKKTTKKKQSIDFIDSDDEEIIKNLKKENNKEEINQLTKDLLNQNTDIKGKTFSKLEIKNNNKNDDNNSNSQNNNNMNINTQYSNNKEKENNISKNQMNKEEINNEENKKKTKKKNYNLYDFII